MEPFLNNTSIFLMGNAIQIGLLLLSRPDFKKDIENMDFVKKLFVCIGLFFMALLLVFALINDWNGGGGSVTTVMACFFLCALFHSSLIPKIQEWTVLVWTTALMSLLFQKDLFHSSGITLLIALGFFFGAIYVNLTHSQLSKFFSVGGYLVYSASVLMISWVLVGDISFLLIEDPRAFAQHDPYSSFLIGMLYPTLVMNAMAIFRFLPGRGNSFRNIQEHYTLLSEKYLHHQTPSAAVILFFILTVFLVYLNYSVFHLKESSVVTLVILIGQLIARYWRTGEVPAKMIS